MRGLKKEWVPEFTIGKSRKKKHEPLTKEQRELVENHLDVAKQLAYIAIKKTNGHTGCYTVDDLRAVGYFALCVAATRYDKTKKASFKTYAWHTIRGYIQHALRDRSRMIKLPRWVPVLREEVRKLSKSGKTVEEIAKILDISPKQVYYCDKSWHEIHTPITIENKDWIDHCSTYLKKHCNNKLLSYVNTLSSEEIEELTAKALKGDLNDERIQTIMILG